MNGILSTPNPYLLIQARLGSTRLNGKVLLSLSEDSIDEKFTLLDHIFLRLNLIFSKSNIIFLIPDSDLPLREFLTTRNYNFFVGSETNVRKRYIDCAEKYGIKDIFRLTGDNPFIDLESIQFLWEALFHLNSRYYSLSISGLPLGMGIECFSYESLIFKNDVLNEERHLEHVSLHIKENPKDHQIIRLNAPHLNKEERHRSQFLRITIDEDKDLRLAKKLWKVLGKKNPHFGAKEVLNLHKTNPEIFNLNSEVEQVKFSLPESKKTKKQVTLIYADPKSFGTGHWERCLSLSIFLQVNGIDVELSNHLTNDSSLKIFDTRENYSETKNAFFIDNLNHLPQNENACFLLPHPSIKYENETKISFYTSPLIQTLKENRGIPGSLFVYLGGLSEEDSSEVDSFILKQLKPEYGIDQIIRVGGKPSRFSEIQYFERLPKLKFYNDLNNSEYVLTYYGLTLLESYFLKKKCFVMGISEVHETLGIFASTLFDIPYLGSLSKLNQRSFHSSDYTMNRNAKQWKLHRILELNAHHKILKWIQNQT